MDKVRGITLKRHPVKDFSLQAGDTAKVSLRVKEGGKERIQVFEGVVLKIKENCSFTIRKNFLRCGSGKDDSYGQPQHCQCGGSVSLQSEKSALVLSAKIKRPGRPVGCSDRV